MKKRLFKHEHVKSKNAKIRRYVLAHPEAKCADVATLFDTDVQTVYNARYTLRKLANKKLKTTRSMPISEPMQVVMVEDKKPDMVNSPPHYKVGGLETIDILKAKLTKDEFRGYLKGNVIKYATRASYKGSSTEDAGKLAWYAQRLAELGD